MGQTPANSSRKATQRRRRPPGRPSQLLVAFEGDGKLPDDVGSGHLEITLETTNANGDLADWFDDIWWTDVIERCGRPSATLHLAPTAGALLHRVVLHELEMIRRVLPHWRIVGHAYRDDLTTPDEIELLACSPYREVCILDERRPGDHESGRMNSDRTVDELFGSIRREQVRLGTTMPILVRVPPGRGRHTSSQTYAGDSAVPAKAAKHSQVI